MVALNFPTPTAVGQIYTAGVSSWQWDGTAWNIVPLITPPIADDDAPANPYPGQLWWNALNGNLYVWYQDANSAQWVQTAGNTGAAYKTAEARNRVVNPAMQISEENGTTSGTASGYYPVDQFTLLNSIANVSTVCQPTAGPDGLSTISTGITTAKPSLAAGDYWQFMQNIEGVQVADFLWGAVGAKPVVARFWAYATLAGTYTFRISNPAANRMFLAPFTLAAGVWTEVVIPVPGDTTGVWPIGVSNGLSMGWGLAAGATYNTGVAGWSAANLVQLAGNTSLASVANSSFNLANVGLYLDPDNTGKAPPFVVPDYGDALEACRRYWRRNPLSFGSWLSTTTTWSGVCNLSPPMRITPVMSIPGAGATGAIEELGVAFRDLSALPTGAGGTNNENIQIRVTTAASTAAYRPGALISGRLALNARL